jgi:hypothetical protein
VTLNIKHKIKHNAKKKKKLNKKNENTTYRKDFSPLRDLETIDYIFPSPKSPPFESPRPGIGGVGDEGFKLEPIVEEVPAPVPYPPWPPRVELVVCFPD